MYVPKFQLITMVLNVTLWVYCDYLVILCVLYCKIVLDRTLAKHSDPVVAVGRARIIVFTTICPRWRAHGHVKSDFAAETALSHKRIHIIISHSTLGPFTMSIHPAANRQRAVVGAVMLRSVDWPRVKSVTVNDFFFPSPLLHIVVT